jgi:hypothetical protein
VIKYSVLPNSSLSKIAESSLVVVMAIYRESSSSTLYIMGNLPLDKTVRQKLQCQEL